MTAAERESDKQENREISNVQNISVVGTETNRCFKISVCTDKFTFDLLQCTNN